MWQLKPGKHQMKNMQKSFVGVDYTFFEKHVIHERDSKTGKEITISETKKCSNGKYLKNLQRRYGYCDNADCSISSCKIVFGKEVTRIGEMEKIKKEDVTFNNPICPVCKIPREGKYLILFTKFSKNCVGCIDKKVVTSNFVIQYTSFVLPQKARGYLTMSFRFRNYLNGELYGN